MKHLLLLPIRFYRRFISSAKSVPSCRFSPTCSCYAYHAISEWGFFVGIVLSVWRLLRCNPFGKGGRDPVPRRARKLIPKTAALKKRAVKSKKALIPPYLMMYEIYL